MSERKGAVTMKGNPLTLVGNEVKVGQMAPDCTLTGNDMAPVKLSDFRGKVLRDFLRAVARHGGLRS